MPDIPFAVLSTVLNRLGEGWLIIPIFFDPDQLPALNCTRVTLGLRGVSVADLTLLLFFAELQVFLFVAHNCLNLYSSSSSFLVWGNGSLSWGHKVKWNDGIK